MEECLLSPPSPTIITSRMVPVANSHPTEDEDEDELEDEESTRKLHQSTDSGLSGDGDISTTSSNTNPSNPQQQKATIKNAVLSGSATISQQSLSVNTRQNIGKLRSLVHPPASISPDSALFDIPLSDCSSYDDENLKQVYQRKFGKCSMSPEKRRYLQHSNNGIQIEEIKVINKIYLL